MEDYRQILDRIDEQAPSMLDLVIQWSRINSYTFNLAGLKKLSQEIRTSFQVLEAHAKSVELPPMEFINSDGETAAKTLGDALLFSKRPHAQYQVLLVCHMDTVYPLPAGEETPDQSIHDIRQVEDNILNGAGVADAKGGIVVMLKALEAVEGSSFKNKIGWQIIINPDEEAGSPGSRNLLKQAAQKAQVGLVFEPCLPNGDIVGARKGSGNFTLVVHGRSAHAGRNPHLGRNAINAVSKCILEISALNETLPGLTVNVGIVEGGHAVNVVPDTAVAKFNVRLQEFKDEEEILAQIKRIVNKFDQLDGISVSLHGGFMASPKNIEGVTLDLLQGVKFCASQLGFNIDWHLSGGVCDGNRLEAFGLPNVDTMGVKGGDLHSPDEYLCIDSLAQRTKLAALFLMKLGAGELL